MAASFHPVELSAILQASLIGERVQDETSKIGISVHSAEVKDQMFRAFVHAVLQTGMRGAILRCSTISNRYPRLSPLIPEAQAVILPLARMNDD